MKEIHGDDFLSSDSYAIRIKSNTTFKGTPGKLVSGRDMVLPKPDKHLRKLEAPRTGPHTVTAIYTYGTLRIQKGNESERVNIRRFSHIFNTLTIREVNALYRVFK
jgi:hypothetical protein